MDVNRTVAAVWRIGSARLIDVDELPGATYEGAAPDELLDENRWLAARHGLDARFADYRTGERRHVRELLAERVELLAPTAERLGCAQELHHGRGRGEVDP